MNPSIRRYCKPEKAEYAIKGRLKPTPSEACLWAALKPLRNPQWKFRRQVVILGWIADFYCPRKRLIVEVDGGYHTVAANKARDAERDRIILSKLGIKTIRFTNDQVINSTIRVVAEILAEVDKRPTFSSWNQKIA